MNYAIEKSGTGIERSGTGIERSGTGIERSGTGSKFKRAALGFGAAIALTAVFSVNAMEPQVLVTRSAESVHVSVHSEHSILVGSVQMAATSNYVVINLREATSIAGSNAGDSDLMVNGSGGGSPDGSCSPEGSKLMVNGSGGGSPDTSCTPNESSLMVNGSGGGSPGSSCNPGGSGLMVNGSGGGSSSDGEADCMNKVIPWGSAELVFDPAGTSIIIHRNGPTGPEEFMVEFVGATQSTSANAYSAVSRTQPRRVALQ